MMCAEERIKVIREATFSIMIEMQRTALAARGRPLTVSLHKFLRVHLSVRFGCSVYQMLLLESGVCNTKRAI